MSNKILMPALSPTMTEGNLTKWIVKVGDQVKAGDILAEIETDKATMEVEAVDEGVITKILIKEGQESVAVNSPIAILDGNDQKNDSEELEEPKEDENNILLDNQNKKNNELRLKETVNINREENKKKIKKNSKFNPEIKSSPYVRNMASKQNINLSLLKGSGPNGRIIKKDLNIDNFKKNELNKEYTPSLMRKIIAERTTLTKQTVPHFYLTIESNLDKLLNMRAKINNNFNNKISINDILVKAIALAQKMNPQTNVSWIDGKIIKHNSIDVSIAVALKEGLITPIVENADTKGLKEISNEIRYLIQKAKKGTLLPKQYNGGTISLSNLGMFGITEFSAIINSPQSAILAVGSIIKVPSFVDDEIKVINILKSTLSADHRVLDGSVAGKLLKDFNDIIENPFNLWLMSDDMEVI